MRGRWQLRWDHPAWIAGVLIGAMLVPATLAASSFPRGKQSLGLDATFTVASTGEINLLAGTIARGADMRPGAVIRGSRWVRNQTGSALTVSVRALPSNPDADKVLKTRLLVDGEPFFDGTLGELRRWTPHWFQLKVREQRRLQIEVEMPPIVAAAYAGVVVDVPIELRAKARKR